MSEVHHTAEAVSPEQPTTHAVPPVTGYRPLSDADVDRMNRIKAKGAELMVLFEEVCIAAQAKGNELWAAEQNAATLLRAAEQAGEPEHIARMAENLKTIQTQIQHFQMAEPLRWANIGRTDIQQGVMALVRAVAQPDGLI
ncbi:hypothetical protein NAD41_002374 [Salmonella enterica]|nr:hypothetical protein [Salmonella enterica]EKK6596342.1 hypothetical protein [Salmonella enterica]